MSTLSRQTAIKVIYWNAVAAVMLVCLAGASITRRLHAYDALIVRISRVRGLDPRLVAAVIWRESRFEPTRIGRKGEIGLMQVTETVGLEWAGENDVESFVRSDLFDPRVNLEAGTWYLSLCIRNWSAEPDPLPYALAEYNAGRVNALRWAEKSGQDTRRFVDDITYKSTRTYVTSILERYRGGV